MIVDHGIAANRTKRIAILTIGRAAVALAERALVAGRGASDAADVAMAEVMSKRGA